MSIGYGLWRERSLALKTHPVATIIIPSLERFYDDSPLRLIVSLRVIVRPRSIDRETPDSLPMRRIRTEVRTLRILPIDLWKRYGRRLAIIPLFSAKNLHTIPSEMFVPGTHRADLRIFSWTPRYGANCSKVSYFHDHVGGDLKLSVTR